MAVVNVELDLAQSQDLFGESEILEFDKVNNIVPRKRKESSSSDTSLDDSTAAGLIKKICLPHVSVDDSSNSTLTNDNPLIIGSSLDKHDNKNGEENQGTEDQNNEKSHVVVQDKSVDEYDVGPRHVNLQTEPKDPINNMNVNTGSIEESPQIYLNEASEFALKIWMIDHLRSTFTGEKTNVTSEGHEVDIVLSFLQADWKELEGKSAIAMQVFKWIAKNLSEFIAGILLVDYIRGYEPAHLLIIYQYRSVLGDDLSHLVEMIIVHILQGLALTEYPNIDFLKTLPEPIKKKLNFDFCSTFKTSKCFQPQESRTLITTTEMRCSIQMSKLLVDLAMRHVLGVASASEDVYCYSNYSNYFNQFILNYMETLPLSSHNVYNTLFCTAQTQKIHTRLYQMQTKYYGKLSLNVHDVLLKVYGLGEPAKETKVIVADLEDFETFVNILYNPNYKNQMMYSNITTGVCEIADYVGVKDIWFLLFRGNYNMTSYMEQNSKSLLPVLFKLDRDIEINNVIVQVINVYPASAILNLIVMLEPRHIRTLIQHKSLVMDNLDKYKLLIRWAYSVKNIECTDPLNAYFDADVNQNFLQVKAALPLGDMEEHFGMFSKLGYIGAQDMLSAWRVT